MKTSHVWRHTLALCLSLGLAAASQMVSAAPIASDNFTYRDGPLGGNDGGSGWASPWEGAGFVASGIAGTLNTAAFRNFGTAITPSAGTSLYVSIVMAADSQGRGDYAGVSFFSGGSERAFFGMSFDTNNYGINVSGFVNTDSGVAVTGEPRLLIGEILFTGPDTLIANLYVDSPAQRVSTYSGSFYPGGGAWDVVRLNSFSPDGTPARYDDLRIGTTLADVTVPEPTTAALVALGLLGAAASRRRKH